MFEGGRYDELRNGALERIAPWLHPRLASTGGVAAMRAAVGSPRPVAASNDTAGVDFWAAHLGAYIAALDLAAGCEM